MDLGCLTPGSVRQAGRRRAQANAVGLVRIEGEVITFEELCSRLGAPLAVVRAPLQKARAKAKRRHVEVTWVMLRALLLANSRTVNGNETVASRRGETPDE